MSAQASASDDAFLAHLRSFVDRPTAPARTGGDLVNVPMTRHWCMAIGDANPIYRDENAARAAGFPAIPAHPTLMQSWTHHDRRYPAPADAQDYPEEQLFRVLAEAGFSSVVATSSDQEYFEYFLPGDQVTMSGTLLSVSPRKTTALGEGHFVSSRLEYRDQHGTLKGQLTWTVFRFRPAQAAQPPAAARAQEPADAGSQAAAEPPATPVEQLATGHALASRVMAITPTLIVVGAIDSRDFHPVHHDRDKAQAGGTRDIIMNVFTTVGLLGTYVTDRTGPGSLLKRVAVRLGVPNYPGDTMVLQGVVTSAVDDAHKRARTVEVAVTARNGLGQHASATIVVAVPRGGEVHRD